MKYSHPDSSGLKFYAGAPLISTKGYSLGTLCVADEIAKSLKHNQIEGLRLLADQVVSMIENDNSSKKIKDSKNKQVEELIEITGKYYSSATILFAQT